MREGLLAEVVTIEGYEDDLVPAYLARPVGAEPAAGIVVLHHRDGWDTHSREICRRFAAEGFAAIMPHLHYRNGPDLPAEEAAARAQDEGGIADDQVLADARAAMSFVRTQPFGTGTVGIVGYCSGGRQAYLAACVDPYDAAVVCYGTRMVARGEQLSEKRPRAPIELTEGLRAPLLGLFGADDDRPGLLPEDRSKIEERLQKAGKVYRFREFEGAGHAFFAANRTAYHPQAAVEGWQEKLAWLAEHLDGA